jgi:hypothetical protein
MCEAAKHPGCRFNPKGIREEDAMSVRFDVYRIGHNGRRELVRSTQSAREAREVRDAGSGKMLVVVRDDGEESNGARTLVLEAHGDIEGDFLI